MLYQAHLMTLADMQNENFRSDSVTLSIKKVVSDSVAQIFTIENI